MALGLEAAHKAGLIHRDIKPANLWVEEGTERIKILDFGLSRIVDGDSALTARGAVIGTPTYMAPEQVEGKTVDPRCDLFSLGCVLYEAAAGKKAFQANSLSTGLKATAVQDPTHLHELAPAMPAPFCNLVMQLLDKDPLARPASATEVVERLQVMAGIWLSPVETHRNIAKLKATVRFPLLKRRPPRKWLLVRLTCLAIAAAGGALLTYSITRGKEERVLQSAGPIQGVAKDEIVLGMTAPFSGPARELGREMKLGIETCFREINAEGGIRGRKLRLVALDDGYQPDQALANMKKLDEDERVFAVIGNVGTPTAEKTLPYALSKPMIFMGALSGDPHLRRDPPDRYVFNYRPSFGEETAAIVKHLMEVRHIQAEEIAVFAEQDGYGNAGFNGVARALRPHGRQREQILRAGYKQNTAQVTEAAQEILKHKEIRAVVMVATYHAAAEFIHQLKDANADLIFANVSFVGSDVLAEELRQLGPRYADGVIVTQVVPHPESHSSAVLKFREALRQHSSGEQAGFVSLEGYIDALILAEGLRRAGANPTTETLVEALESIHGLDIGLGTPLTFGPSEHQASHKVWGSVLDADGRVQILQLE
jgi:ABC-type branched-subunit amino acid transport system substrate-binding protein